MICSPVPITEKPGRFLPKGWPRRENERCCSASQFTRYPCARFRGSKVQIARDSPVAWLRERDRTSPETSTGTEMAEAFQKDLSWRDRESSPLEQMLSTMQAQSNLIGLPLGARCGCM